MRRVATLLLLVGLAATGCADDGGSGGNGSAAADDVTTTSIVDDADSDTVCEHLGRVDQLDAESGRVTDSAVAQMNAGAEPAVVIAAIHESAALIESSGPEAAAAYAAAAAAADPEVAIDIEAVAAASATLAPAMVAALRAVDSVDDLATLEQAFSSPELLAAARSGAAAVQSLNRFTEAVCGFTLD
jgi:hypothetical protein